MLGVAEVFENPAGPFHKYVPTPVAVSFISAPVHTGLFELAVAVGKIFTVTLAVAVAVHPLASVIKTVYVPVRAGNALAIVGSCTLAVYPFGPLQAYDETVLPVPDKVAPDFKITVSLAQITFPLAVATGFTNTLTLTTAVAEQPTPLLTVMI